MSLVLSYRPGELLMEMQHLQDSTHLPEYLRGERPQIGSAGLYGSHLVEMMLQAVLELQEARHRKQVVTFAESFLPVLPFQSKRMLNATRGLAS